MRLFIIIPSSVLLAIAIFFLGMGHNPRPETVFPNPKNAKEWIARGELYKQREDYDRALADYIQAAKLEPDNSSAYLGQASALSGMKRHAEAIEKYQIVRQLDQQKGFSTRLVDSLIEFQQEQLKQQK